MREAPEASARSAEGGRSGGMTPTVAVCETLAEMIRQRADDLGVPIHVARVAPDGTVDREASTIQAAIQSGNLKISLLRTLVEGWPSMRWIHSPSAGVEGLMAPEILQPEMVITRTRGGHDAPVAEFAMGLILLAAKGFRAILEAQERRDWLRTRPALLEGATLVIVGYGEIGRALARRAKAFNMRVIGVRRRPQPDGLADAVVGADRSCLREALAQADYTVLAAPSTPATHHLIGAAEIQAMPERAFLVNVGRGSLVDEQALEEGLRAGRIAGALLDAFSIEPLPQDHPFWSNPRVVITPHLAGLRVHGFSGPQVDQFLENVRRFGQGEPLLHQIDRDLGY